MHIYIYITYPVYIIMNAYVYNTYIYIYVYIVHRNLDMIRLQVRDFSQPQ